jgi:hypothetical protein
MKKSYYPTGDPEQCRYRFNLVSTQTGENYLRECHAKALFQVGKLRLCYGCFERYLSLHADVDFRLVQRLSDDDRDFTENFAARRGVRKVEAVSV